MLLEVDVDAPARAGDARRRGAPSGDTIAPVGLRLEQIQSGANNIDFPPNAEPFLEALDSLIVCLLEHERFAHTCEYIIEYTWKLTLRAGGPEGPHYDYAITPPDGRT